MSDAPPPDDPSSDARRQRATSPSLPPVVRTLPLPYATHQPTDALPARLITIGVISCILGAVGLIVSVISLVLIGVAAGSRAGAASAPTYGDAAAPAPPPPPAVGLVPHNGDFVRAGGLHRDDRKLVMDAVAAKVTLVPDRREMLNRFLFDAGADAFGLPPVDRKAVQASLRHERESPALRAPDVLITPTGRVEVLNTAVAFQPTAGGQVTRLKFNALETGDARSVYGAWLLNQWIESQRAEVQLNALQAAAILERASQWSVSSHRKEDLEGFWISPDWGRLSDDHTAPIVTIGSGHSRTYFLPDGRVGHAKDYPYGFDSRTLEPRKPVASPYAPLPQQRLRGAGSAVVAALVLLCLASIVLCVLLLVAAVDLLAKRSGGARMHRLWAWTQFPAAVLSLLVVGWTYDGIDARSSAYEKSAILVLVSLIYPTVVLFVLGTPVARGYFRARHEQETVFDHTAPDGWIAMHRRLVAHPAGRVAVVTAAVAAAVAAVMQVLLMLPRTSGSAADDVSPWMHMTLLTVAVGLAALCGVWLRSEAPRQMSDQGVRR